jgi:hypothetical protein
MCLYYQCTVIPGKNINTIHYIADKGTGNLMRREFMRSQIGVDVIMSIKVKLAEDVSNTANLK